MMNNILERCIPRRLALKAITGAISPFVARASPSTTEFQISCMTWPYRQFPFHRALKGIAAAGYRYVAWGPWHADAAGNSVEVIAPGDPPARARQLAIQCTELGLRPVMMFGVTVQSSGYLEQPGAVDSYRRRIDQAAAAKIPFILAFGSPKAPPSVREIWVENLKILGPIARAAGVTVVIKQHGGVSATGRLCAGILREVNDAGIRMFYDPGNTRWHTDVDPLSDVPSCVEYIRGFAIKDFRGQPKRVICGPGLGEIDHFKLLLPVARTGLEMPLVCETLFEPFVPPPTTPEAVDGLARRAREFLETMTKGIKAALSG